MDLPRRRCWSGCAAPERPSIRRIRARFGYLRAIFKLTFLSYYCGVEMGLAQLRRPSFIRVCAELSFGGTVRNRDIISTAMMFREPKEQSTA